MPSQKHSKTSTKLRVLSLIWTALVLLSACGTTVHVKEENFYTDKGPDGAVITHFFATDIKDISKPAWDSMREGMTCMSAQAIGDIKSEIEKLCTESSCDKQTVKAIEAALNRLEIK